MSKPQNKSQQQNLTQSPLVSFCAQCAESVRDIVRDPSLQTYWFSMAKHPCRLCKCCCVCSLCVDGRHRRKYGHNCIVNLNFACFYCCEFDQRRWRLVVCGVLYLDFRCVNKSDIWEGSKINNTKVNCISYKLWNSRTATIILNSIWSQTHYKLAGTKLRARSGLLLAVSTFHQTRNVERHHHW